MSTREEFDGTESGLCLLSPLEVVDLLIVFSLFFFFFLFLYTSFSRYSNFNTKKHTVLFASRLLEFWSPNWNANMDYPTAEVIILSHYKIFNC